MTKKPGLKGRSKSIKAALAAAGTKPGKAKSSPKPTVKKKTVQKSTPAEASYQGIQASDLMPNDANSKRILEDRAKIYARPPKFKRKTHGGQAFVQIGFGGGDRYGIPFRYADEIMAAGEITKVPGTPAHIVGVINLRGTLVTVVDLSQFFGIGAAVDRQDRSIVVVSGGNLRFGILADVVDGSVSYTTDDLDPTVGGVGNSDQAYIQGIHDGKVAVLDIGALIEDPAILVDQRTGKSAVGNER